MSASSQAALREVEECLRANPLCLDGHREAARTRYAMGRCDQALSAWNKRFGWPRTTLTRTLARPSAIGSLPPYSVAAVPPMAAARPPISHERGLNGQSIEALTSALGGPTARAAGLFLAQVGLEAGAVDCVRAAFAGCARVLDPSAGEQLGNDCGASEIAQACGRGHVRPGGTAPGKQPAARRHKGAHTAPALRPGIFGHAARSLPAGHGGASDRPGASAG